MTTTAEEIQTIIKSINDLSALVGRYAYGEAPEEADDAQRAGFEAIRKLKTLKEELGARTTESVEISGAADEAPLEQEAA